MRYLSYPYENSFKELCAAYPLFYLDVFEMRAILKAQGRSLDDVNAGIELMVANNFVRTADEPTVRLWEEALQITYTEALTLDQRKSVIIGRLCGYGHIGEPEIRAIVGQYTENTVAVGFGKGIISLVIDGEIFDEANLLKTLLARIPAHLRLAMQINIRREFRQALDVRFGAAAIPKFKAPPVSEDRVSVAPLPVAYGGMATSKFTTQPVGEDRIAVSSLPVARGGLLETAATGTQPETETVSTRRTGGAGGIYYHTHTKSKLIE